jgi:hypothetical protein
MLTKNMLSVLVDHATKYKENTYLTMLMVTKEVLSTLINCVDKT